MLLNRFLLTLFIFLPLSLSAESNKPKLIWDYWYTVTVGKNLPVQYYREKFEKIGNRLRIQQRIWKSESGFINEENLGSFAKDDEELTPLFFNFSSTYRSREIQIDGTVQPGRKLFVKVRKNQELLPPIEGTAPRKTIFSSFFPVLLGKQLKSLKVRKVISFETILEDSPDLQFKIVGGQYWLDDPDKYAKQTGTSRIQLKYQNVDSTWWIRNDGSVQRISIPSQQIELKTATEKEAKSFFKSL